MWQPNERKRGPRNWAQKLVSVVPHGVLPKFQKKKQKKCKKVCGGVATPERATWLLSA